MSVEDELRALRAPEPAGLVPPPDLADTVLHGLRRRRRRTALAAVAVLAAAVAVPVAGLRAGPADPAGTPVGVTTVVPDPDPGPATPDRLVELPGGPVTIVAFTVARTGRTSLLDPATGRYVELPYEAAVVSPDQRTVAVYDGLRTGVVARDALLRRDTDGLRWTGLTGGPPSWSPDGTALLVTRIEKQPVRTWVLGRYDLATARLGTTRLADPPAVGDAVWAANSRDYLLARAVVVDGGTAQPLGMRVYHPDGTTGPLWGGPAGAVAYSPDRRRATVDPGGLPQGRTAETAVVETATGALVGGLAGGDRAGRPTTVGWYDADTVVRLLDAPELQVVDVRTGAIVRAVRLAQVPALSGIQLGRVTGKAPGF